MTLRARRRQKIGITQGGQGVKQINDRRNDMRQYLQKEMEKSFRRVCDEFQSEIERDGGKIWNEIKEILDEVSEKIVMGQREGKKGKIKYLSFNFLQLSSYTNKLQWYITAFDENFYIDEQDVGIYYSPIYLNEKYLHELEYMNKILRQKYIRIQNYEWDIIKRVYAVYYDSIMQVLLENLLEMMREYLATSDICISNKVLIIYGQYMDEAKILYEVG